MASFPGDLGFHLTILRESDLALGVPRIEDVERLLSWQLAESPVRPAGIAPVSDARRQMTVWFDKRAVWGSALTYPLLRGNDRRSYTPGRLAVPRAACLAEDPMNKPGVHHSTQSAAPVREQTATSKQATVLPSSKTAIKPNAELKVHVCTDACTHEGAATRASASSAESGAVDTVPSAVKTGSNAAARRR